MHVRNVLAELAERGIALRYRPGEDRLNAKPTSALTPKLIAEIKEHKEEIVKAMREDRRLEETGIIQSERQVFDLARKWFRRRGEKDCLSNNEGG